MSQEAYNILGLMSGSSCDSLDAALCRFQYHEENGLIHEVLETRSFSFTDTLKNGLPNIASKSLSEVKNLESVFSKFLVGSVQRFDKSIDFIASHGHTVLHHPEESYTWQIGNPAIIAAQTNTPVIYDFRSLDVALGGQGAPVAPLADKYILKEHTFCINLGGIVNIGINGGDKLLGFDICPCNQILNALCNTINLEFDDKGKLAATGNVNDSYLEQLLDNNYLQLDYPKSLDNSWVKINYTDQALALNLKLEDRLRTFVEFIAIAIKDQLLVIVKKEQIQLKSKNLVCTGGGAFNTFLMERIIHHCSMLDVEVVIPPIEIIEYKEAILMGLMGYLRVLNKPNCFASVTGATRNSSGGVIYYP